MTADRDLMFNGLTEAETNETASVRGLIGRPSPAEGYGSTDLPYTFSVPQRQETLRLLSWITSSFGNDHPAYADVEALAVAVLDVQPKHTAKELTDEQLIQAGRHHPSNMPAWGIGSTRQGYLEACRAVIAADRALQAPAPAQSSREAFEAALKTKPEARFWNTTDAMFWAFQAGADQAPAVVDEKAPAPCDCPDRGYCDGSCSPGNQPSDGLPNIVTSAPETIYLVIDPDLRPEADFREIMRSFEDSVQWCAEDSYDNGIKYVRADIATQPLPKGWTFNHAQQQKDEDGPVDGVWEIGYLDPEDYRFSPIVTVDAGLYYQGQDAEPLARAILARLTDSYVPVQGSGQ